MSPVIHRRTITTALGLMGAVTMGAFAQEDGEEEGPISAMRMLEDGSILKKIIVPQYDEELRLSSVMRAEKLIRVDDDTLEATKVDIEFFHSDQTKRGSIYLGDALLEDQRFLRSDKPVALTSDDLAVNGKGLIYEIEKERGFIFGPATATTLLDTRKSMKASPSYRFAPAGIMMLAASALHAEGLNRLTPEELSELDARSASQSEKLEASAEEAAQIMERIDKQSEKADQEVVGFLRANGITTVATGESDAAEKPPVPDPEPLPEDKTLAQIDADEGIYFDSTEGMLVFLKNVKVDHPEFNMTGADEVKVFLEKEEEETKGDKEPKEGDGGNQQPEPKPEEKPEADGKKEKEEEMFAGPKFGDPTEIIANGVVVIEKKKTGPDSKAAKASGHEISLNLKTNELIIRGGNPWIISESARGRIIDPNGYIRMNVKTGDASFVGKSEALVRKEGVVEEAEAND